LTPGSVLSSTSMGISMRKVSAAIRFPPSVGIGVYLRPHGCPDKDAGSWARHGLLGRCKAGGSRPRLKTDTLQDVVEQGSSPAGHD
ncbi:MAG: hypothetical protein U0N22_02255, partial [Acutalibacter sp.]